MVTKKMPKSFFQYIKKKFSNKKCILFLVFKAIWFKIKKMKKNQTKLNPKK